MRTLLLDPDDRLRRICSEVKTIDSYVKALANELTDFIRRGPVKYKNKKYKDWEITPLGMAAPQLGELISLFVIDTPAFSLTMINPRLIKTAGSHKLDEGCLSLPGRMFIVERPKVIKFKGLDLEGKERSIKLHDTLAQCVMHELEHLQGILVDNIAITEITAPAPHA